MTDITETLDHRGQAPDLVARFHQDMEDRRTAIDTMDSMSRGIQGINLNQGQDFDGVLLSLIDLMVPEIRWDLDQALPELRRILAPTAQVEEFHDDRYLLHHAPSHVSPSGPRWYDRFSPIARIHALFTHLQDYPSTIPEAMRPGKVSLDPETGRHPDRPTG